jgi:OmcA/MtrC family decaheme c-type cytochrome
VAAVGAPAFFAAAADATTGQVASNLSFLKGFGQGDDWVNDGAATSPGQANAVHLPTTNTTCSGNVATTTFALTAAEQTSAKNGRGVLALQGKAQVIAPNAKVVQVRSKTPTREYVVATGALPAQTRRPIIDSAACLKCHVGSMYQHGGNRVDNIEMCVICHNEASSEQNIRESMGVTAAEAYDGQAGQTYGFKSFLHAVHSAGETGKITALYREAQGIFVWAAHDTVVPNFPGTGDQFVYGSSRPTGTGPNGEISKPHTFHAPTYPRLLNDCAACHVSSFADVPSQSVAVATTINTGASVNGQLDDVLEGTVAATCMSCHQSGDAGVQASLKGHAYQNGWTPQVFAEGRKTILEAK